MNNKVIIEFGFRRIWRILQISEIVIYLGLRPLWITPFSICRILHILRKPNSIIANSSMALNLSGQTSIFGDVSLYSSLFGIEREKKLIKNFTILTRKLRNHVGIILIYRTWPIFQLFCLNRNLFFVFFGRYDKAEPLYVRAYQIRLKVWRQESNFHFSPWGKTSLKGLGHALGHAILGNFSTDQMAIELTKIWK